MRIVNVTSQPRHFSYASPSSGGRTLKSGETSPELPLEFLFNPLVLRDVETGITQLQLSTDDRVFIERVLAYAERPIKVKKPSKPKPKPKPQSQSKPAVTSKPKPKPAIPDLKDVTPEALAAGEISLSDLHNQNKRVLPGVPLPDYGKSTKQEIDAFKKGRF